MAIPTTGYTSGRTQSRVEGTAYAILRWETGLRQCDGDHRTQGIQATQERQRSPHTLVERREYELRQSDGDASRNLCIVAQEREICS